MKFRRVDRRLVFVDGSAPRAATSDRSALIAESDAGVAAVWGWFEAPAGEVRIPGLATFSFSRESDIVEAHLDPGASRENAVHSFYATAMPLIAWACDDLEALHASGVRLPQGVIAFAGPSESGKTTLAHAFAARGHGHFAEDVVAFYASADGVWATPLPYTVNLRAATSDHFARSRTVLPAANEVRRPAGVDSRLVTVVVLDPATSTSSSALLEQLAPSEALLALLPNAHRFKNQPADRERKMLEVYLELVGEVPVFRLTYQQDFDSLDAVLERVEHAVIP